VSWKPSSPGAGAVGEGEPVPLGLLPVALGPVVLAGDGCCLGRVVHRRGVGQGLDHGLPGPGQLAGPEQPALLDQEVGGRGRLGVLDAGQRLDLVQHRGQHLALLHGDRAGGQRVQHARVAAQRGRLAQPGAAVGAGEPQPVGQPPLVGRRTGARLQVPGLDLGQQHRLQCDGQCLQTHEQRQPALHVAVCQSPHRGGVGLGQRVACTGQLVDHREVDEDAGRAHDHNLERGSDTTPYWKYGQKLIVDNGFRPYPKPSTIVAESGLTDCGWPCGIRLRRAATGTTGAWSG
jgi:hypothetical protein